MLSICIFCFLAKARKATSIESPIYVQLFFSKTSSASLLIAPKKLISFAFFKLSPIILPLSLYALWKLPNEKRVAFYDEYLIIFPPKRYDVCQKITYDEIVEWRVTQGKTGADSFILRLTNERYITTDCFNAVKIYKAMDSIIPDKEANYVRKKNTPNTPFTFNFGKKRKK